MPGGVIADEYNLHEASIVHVVDKHYIAWCVDMKRTGRRLSVDRHLRADLHARHAVEAGWRAFLHSRTRVEKNFGSLVANSEGGVEWCGGCVESSDIDQVIVARQVTWTLVDGVWGADLRRRSAGPWTRTFWRQIEVVGAWLLLADKLKYRLRSRHVAEQLDEGGFSLPLLSFRLQLDFESLIRSWTSDELNGFLEAEISKIARLGVQRVLADGHVLADERGYVETWVELVDVVSDRGLNAGTSLSTG